MACFRLLHDDDDDDDDVFYQRICAATFRVHHYFHVFRK